jgi:hypothetical protein
MLHTDWLVLVWLLAHHVTPLSTTETLNLKDASPLGLEDVTH